MQRFRHAGAALTTVLTVAACASGGGNANPPATTPTYPTVVILDERESRLSAVLGKHVIVDDLTVIDSLEAPVPLAHQAVVATYAALGFRSLLVNPATGLVAVAELPVRSRLAGEALSRFLSCGQTITGPRADTDRITLSVVSHVKAAATTGWTRLETRVVATATETQGTSGRVPCTTTGDLEGRILRGAKAAVRT